VRGEGGKGGGEGGGGGALVVSFQIVGHVYGSFAVRRLSALPLGGEGEKKKKGDRHEEIGFVSNGAGKGRGGGKKKQRYSLKAVTSPPPPAFEALGWKGREKRKKRKTSSSVVTQSTAHPSCR